MNVGFRDFETIFTIPFEAARYMDPDPAVIAVTLASYAIRKLL